MHLGLKILNAFIIIYEKFIRRDFAPFEINIASQTRDNISSWYLKLKEIKRFGGIRRVATRNVLERAQNTMGLAKNGLILTIEELNLPSFDFQSLNFLSLWQDLLGASNEIIALTNQSVLRYYKEQSRK